MIILIVDDDYDDFEVFCDAMKIINHAAECLYQEDGAAALRFLNQPSTKLPDYIFMDINMPVMGGIECLRHLKSDPTLKYIPVILFSTSRNMKEAQHYRDLGARDYIIKPSRFADILSILTDLKLDEQ